MCVYVDRQAWKYQRGGFSSVWCVLTVCDGPEARPWTPPQNIIHKSEPSHQRSLILTKAYDWKMPTTQHIHNTDYSGHVYCEMFENTRSHIHTYAIHCMGLQHINVLCFLHLFPFISYPSLQAISRPTDLRWIVMLVIHKILHIPCLLQIHLFNICQSHYEFLARVNLVNETTDKKVFV